MALVDLRTRDDFGIVTRHRLWRTRHGERRSHGKVASLPWQEPVPVIAAPAKKRPKAAIVNPFAALPQTTPPPRSISARAVLCAVAEIWRIPPADLLSKKLHREFSRPRIAAYLLLRRLTNMSLPAIAFATCRKDHSAVHAGLKRAAALYERDDAWRVNYDAAEVLITLDG